MKIYTTGQVSRICQVATSTVHKWFDTGKLKGFRVPGSRHRRIPRENLLDFLHEHGFPTEDLEQDNLYHVLLVARDEQLHQAIQRETDARSWRLHIAKNSFDAGVLTESVPPHCMVVDFSMGPAEAAAICRNMRRNPGLAEAAVIALAPRTSERFTDPANIDRSHVNEVFYKPFDPKLLAARIASVMEVRV